ncbi:DUF6879 family protein [Saccharopolyspora sp. 5N708]|uniref:DUF6879 family protein n=1 Tax=Saccharopolyspora sp. 5N708 TaxID=3457424 RepID=UPI003FD3D0E6
MRDLPKLLVGEKLAVDAYYRDFEPRFWNIRDHDFWKLERRQSFQEEGSPSWDAFTRGEWDEALRLIAERRESLEDYYDRAARNGFSIYRVRVVVEPISPYLQWELNSLRQRSEIGERIRVVGKNAVSEFEGDGELPEIVTVGSEVVYQVMYDRSGAIEGAIRSTDPRDVNSWREFIQDLYASGEEMASFFSSTVAALTPPSAQ